MGYHTIILPLLALGFAQGVKIFINQNKLSFSVKNLFAYSGMPSGHSALVIALDTIVALEEGLDSSAFALSFILSVIVIRDALGIRRYLGQHGKTLNILVSDLKNDEVLEHQYPRLLEKIGHTPLQVLAGSLIGFFISYAGYILLN